MDDIHLNSYAAYGDRPSSEGNACSGYGGAAAEKDVGGYLLGIRLYLPVIGRFANPDAASPFDGGGVHRYAYCAGDPINRIDPSGESPLAWMRSVVDEFVSRSRWVFGATPPTASVGAAATDSRPGSVRRSLASVRRGVARGGRSLVNHAIRAHEESVARRRGVVVRRIVRRNGQVVDRISGAGVEGWPLRQYMGKVPGPVGPRVQDQYEPNWWILDNGAGGKVHVADTPVILDDVLLQVHLNVVDNVFPGDVVVVAGGHGRSDGANWRGERWRHPGGFKSVERGFYASQADNPHLAGVSIVDIGLLTRKTFDSLVLSDKHVFFNICFMHADEHLMDLFHYDYAATLTRHR